MHSINSLKVVDISSNDMGGWLFERHGRTKQVLRCLWSWLVDDPSIRLSSELSLGNSALELLHRTEAFHRCPAHAMPIYSDSFS
jgi:hypothetical protein